MTIDPFKPIVLSAKAASLTVSVLPFGLTIHSLSTQPDEDFVAGPQDPKDHQACGRAFLNPIIGRFAHRLRTGKSEYKSSEGTSYQIDLPEFSAPGIVLHGGPESDKKNANNNIVQHGPFDRCYWQPLDIADSRFFKDSGFTSQSEPEAEQSSLVFAIESPDGDSGYPGTLRVETLMAIVATPAKEGQLGKSAGRLLIRYRAALVGDSSVEATPLSMTHHWNFNLSASNEEACKLENGKVLDHVVEMYPPAGRSLYQLDQDPSKIATGGLNDASSEDATSFSNHGSHYWHRPGGKKISDNMPAAGYDDFYVWGKDESLPVSDDVNVLATEATRRVRLTSESAGRSLVFYSNQPGTQLYTAVAQPPYPAKSSEAGGAMKQVHRKGDLPDSGNFHLGFAAIELGAPLYGFLRPELRDVGGNDQILERGDVYDHWVVCEAWKL